jgi:hypothetical protein
VQHQNVSYFKKYLDKKGDIGSVRRIDSRLARPEIAAILSFLFGFLRSMPGDHCAVSGKRYTRVTKYQNIGIALY